MTFTAREVVMATRTTITLEERREAAERWQRAVLQVATLNMQRSNEATE